MGIRELCNMGIPAFFAVVAWILTIWSNFLCQSIKFEPLGGSNLPTVRFGIWNYKGLAIYEDYDGNLYAVNKCNSFPDSVEFDAKWKTAQAFSVIAFLLGFLSMFIVCVAPTKMLKKAAVFYVLVAFFQGLTMIQLSSDFCDDNQILAGMADILYQDSCKMDSGFKLNIAATVFYFCAGIACCFIPTNDEVDVDAPNVVEMEKTPDTPAIKPDDPAKAADDEANT